MHEQPSEARDQTTNEHASNEDIIADLEARSRAVERAEAELKSREQELSASSAAMARELRTTAEALRQREQELGVAGGIPERMVSRKDRLGRIRRVLRDRAAKLQRYEAVLEDRAKEADKILAQRREVSRAAAVVAEREKKLEAVQARNKTMTASFFVAAAIGILGVLSFAVADHVAPATYAASVTIEADGRGRELSADELDEWQRYMNGLLMDPGLLEIAADRMNKRGLESLSRAGALRERLDADLTTSSGTTGSVKLELVGEGSGSTSRTLETYVVSLIAQSNATKKQRAGGTGSKLVGEVVIDGEPLQDDRLVYTGAFTGGATLVGFLIGVVSYGRLKAQHKRFEQGVID